MFEQSIQFHKPKNSISRKQFMERVIDWQEEGHHVKSTLLNYDKQYREKICSTCTIEQQRKRDCVKLEMYTSNGIQLKHCSHMDKARVRKHKPMIRNHMQLHPAFKIM